MANRKFKCINWDGSLFTEGKIYECDGKHGEDNMSIVDDYGYKYTEPVEDATSNFELVTDDDTVEDNYTWYKLKDGITAEFIKDMLEVSNIDPCQQDLGLMREYLFRASENSSGLTFSDGSASFWSYHISHLDKLGTPVDNVVTEEEVADLKDKITEDAMSTRLKGMIKPKHHQLGDTLYYLDGADLTIRSMVVKVIASLGDDMVYEDGGVYCNAKNVATTPEAVLDIIRKNSNMGDNDE